MQDVMFHIGSDTVTPLLRWEPPYERYVQETIERNMSILLGCKFIQSEFTLFAGQYRIDSVGLDDQMRPVVIEYKARGDSSVVSQALYYKNALLKCKDSFVEAVSRSMGPMEANNIRWDAITIICIAPSFAFFEKEMVSSLNENIDLIEFSFFAKEMLHLKTVSSTRTKHFGLTKAPLNKSSYAQMEKMLSPRDGALLAKLIMRTCDISPSIVVIKTDDSLEFHLNHLLARIYIDRPDSPKINVLVCGVREDLGVSVDIRSRKTHMGVIMPLKNDEYLHHIVSAIHQAHDRMSIAND